MTTDVINLTLKDQFRVLGRLLKYTLPFKGILALAFTMLIISTVMGVMTPYLVMIFIDDYLTPSIFPEEDIMWLIIAFITVNVVAVLTTYWQIYLLQVLAFKVIQQLRIDAFQKIGKLGMTYFDKVPSGSVVSRLTNDTQAIVDMFTSVLGTFLMAIFMVISSFVMMFILDVKLAFITLIFMPVIIFILLVYRKYSARYFSHARGLLSDMNAKLSESIEGMKIIQVFNQEKRLQREFEVINEEHYQYNLRTIKLDGLLLRPAIDMIYILSIVVILSYFGFLSFETSVTAGVIFAFIQYMERFFEPINQVSQNLNIFQQALVAASRVFTLLDDDRHEPAQIIKKEYKITDGQVEFKNVTFSYDGNVDVLKNISFKVLPGTTTALVGHTGSGKSSIINLMMRFYEYEHGEILIDGHSIKELPKEEMKNNIGLVLQDPFIFYGTLTSNIKLYHSTMTFEMVRSAADFVGADSFINKLKNRYEQKVVEKGADFSSGERQLLAFARTMATNPKILILDEATANIDSSTEEKIQASLMKMRSGRTTLAIAHRLSTIQDADEILVLNKGEIVERGTHDELVQLKGIYYKMYRLQNSKQ
ncbi:ABC transporter ATP-binding protein [Jeotgalicoccus psychrophilus]|uniref:ABC transporter ATP-binding protein n=1 Tax=Jeotgalicoccus psychrophilus TaxID=157228 RepID=UPI0004058062|nr:ABC transporter ATP-binding protein [Jeotgalicoccus psychrophilus]